MINRNSSVPLHRQVRDLIQRGIASGEFQHGAKIASEREWIQRLGVSRITVHQALHDLANEGVLTSVAGRGYFVAVPPKGRDLDPLASFTDVLRAAGVAVTSHVIECTVLAASPAVAHVLGITAGCHVVYLDRVRLVDDEPVVEQRAWMPHKLVPGMAEEDFTTASLFALYRDRYNIVVTKATTTVSARIATAEEAKRLQLDPPGVAISVDQITWDDRGRAVEYSNSVHHPDRLPIQITQSATTLDDRVRPLREPGQ